MDRDITLYKQLVHSPGALRAFRGLGGYIRFKSPLDARLRELAILQVGYLARAEYEWSHHIKLGYTFGVTDADIEALIADTEGRPAQLDPLSALVIKGARVTVASNPVLYRPNDCQDTVLSNFRAYDFVNDPTGSATPQGALFSDQYGDRNVLIEHFEIRNTGLGPFFKGTAEGRFNYGTVQIGRAHV